MRKIIAFISLLLCTVVWAISSPVDLLENTSSQLIAQLRQNQATMRNKPQVVYGIVNQTLLPHVDLVSMSREALGREAWDQATPQQRQAFVYHFTTLYNDLKLLLKSLVPFRESCQPPFYNSEW